MKLTKKQIEALELIGRGSAQFSEINPTTRRSLIRNGLVKKNWNHRHSNPGAEIEYLMLTEEGEQAVYGDNE